MSSFENSVLALNLPPHGNVTCHEDSARDVSAFSGTLAFFPWRLRGRRFGVLGGFGMEGSGGDGSLDGSLFLVGSS